MTGAAIQGGINSYQRHMSQRLCQALLIHISSGFPMLSCEKNRQLLFPGINQKAVRCFA